MQAARIAIVDDDPLFAEYLATFLKSRGYETVVFNSGAGAARGALQGRSAPDVVLLDVLMPDHERPRDAAGDPRSAQPAAAGHHAVRPAGAGDDRRGRAARRRSTTSSSRAIRTASARPRSRRRSATRSSGSALTSGGRAAERADGRGPGRRAAVLELGPRDADGADDGRARRRQRRQRAARAARAASARK